ncbi:nuclear pore complex protein NUP107 [Aristolochia californica]|uniref:nuclear pore complex protein NUP107 n=1 Tax=Aristolochia californica TaxID=171875 RepID=UPI0035DD0D41
MDVDMDASPSYFNPEDLSSREKYRRYGTRHSSSFLPFQETSPSKFAEARITYDGHNIQSRPNAALLLEEIKQEAENVEVDGFERTPAKLTSSCRRMSSLDSQMGSPSLLSCKQEDEVLSDTGETIFGLFSSLLDSTLQGLMSVSDLILQLENTCRNVSEIIRDGAVGRHRVVEDKLMRQRAQLLCDEAASWSLLWYLFGKGTEELPENLILSPPTSHLEACQFVATDHTAQLCLRIVQWLEGLASKSLDLEKKVREFHVGSYLPTSGIWHHTQRFLKKGKTDASVVQHLDFDAPTREVAQKLPDDMKQDESLLEDIWLLLKAGRLEEACELCRSAGQPWRAATLCPFGGLDQFPSIEALKKNGVNRTLQAIELQSGIGHQWRLFRWASFCASEKIAEREGEKYESAIYAAQSSNLKHLLPICRDWESACWAMAKSWLDFKVDLQLANLEETKLEQLKNYTDAMDSSGQREKFMHSSLGPESWPYHILDQQPQDIHALLQKLHSGDMVHEAVSRACKEKHRQIEMNLMLGNIALLLDLLWSWISPSDDQNCIKPHGDAQMIRFAAHLVLVLRYLMADEIKDGFKEKLMTVGDRILNMYAMFLFSQQHEELVGIYGSQLSRHLCVDLFVQMMELKLNSSMQVKYKLFRTAVEHLPFSQVDDSKACFEDILERVLSRSRVVKVGNYDDKSIAEQHRLQSIQKALVIQWLCFTPPTTVNDSNVISAKLVMKALMHSNVLLREFALMSMWRVPKMPVGAHQLLAFLAEPLKQPTYALLSFEEHDISEDLHEFEDWREYYSCDAMYRKWLQIELLNGEIPPSELSKEEKENAIVAARETVNSSLVLLLRKGIQWLSAQSNVHESIDLLYLELHATAMLCLPSGECMSLDATSCTALTTALYSSVSEEVLVNRRLMVNVALSATDSYCVEIVLRCLAVEGDGLGHHEMNDGGLLASVIAAGFKGELGRFQAGITLEISRLDAWYSEDDGSLRGPATYILRGLCRRCCLSELILRCMQVSVSLIESGELLDSHDKLIELVASPDSGLIRLFSQHQLQEFLLFEREYSICSMEFQEERLSVDDS